MRRVIASSKSPQKIVQITGSTVKYDISSTKCLTNIETTSSGTSATEARFSRKNNRYQMMRRQHKNYKQVFAAELFQELLQRRKRYAFQMIKLLYLFPDDTFSENISVNSYDRLFFHDEHIHTMVKIHETKVMQAKIWAFLNLKTLHKKRKLEKFTHKIENVEKRLKRKATKDIFNTLVQFSIKIAPQRKTVKIERMDPIKTRVERNESEILNVTKVEKISEINMVDNTRRIQRNEVIRAQDSSPLVKRIELTPGNGMNIIYPSSTRNHQQHRSVQTSRIRYHQPISSECNSNNVKQFHQTRTTIEENRKVETPRTTIFTGETMKRIVQPARTIPYHVFQPTRVPTQTYEIKDTVSRNRYNDYGYLVHTVQGDCTINVHNACTHTSDNIEIDERRSRSVSIRRPSFYAHPSSSKLIQDYQEMNHHCCCQPVAMSCHCSRRCYNCQSHPVHPVSSYHMGSESQINYSPYSHAHPYSQERTVHYASPYYIEERIQHLRNLQKMNHDHTSAKVVYK